MFILIIFLNSLEFFYYNNKINFFSFVQNPKIMEDIVEYITVEPPKDCDEFR